jgi:Tfp pilus assembly protein PilF
MVQQTPTWSDTRRKTTAMSVLDRIAIFCLGASFLFWGVLYFSLLAPPLPQLAPQTFVAFALIVMSALIIPLFWSILVPTTPAGQLLQKTQWATIGFWCILSAAALGPDHHQVGACLNNLGRVLRNLRQSQEARAAHERALAIYEAALGPDHAEVGSILKNLGSVLRQLGDLQEAKMVLERALAISEAARGPDHRQVGACLHHLGRVLWLLGDLQKARTAHERALEIYEAALGLDRPMTKQRRAHLSQVEQQLKMRPAPDTAS